MELCIPKYLANNNFFYFQVTLALQEQNGVKTYQILPKYRLRKLYRVKKSSINHQIERHYQMKVLFSKTRKRRNTFLTFLKLKMSLIDRPSHFINVKIITWSTLMNYLLIRIKMNITCPNIFVKMGTCNSPN